MLYFFSFPVNLLVSSDNYILCLVLEFASECRDSQLIL